METIRFGNKIVVIVHFSDIANFTIPIPHQQIINSIIKEWEQKGYQLINFYNKKEIDLSWKLKKTKDEERWWNEKLKVGFSIYKVARYYGNIVDVGYRVISFTDEAFGAEEIYFGNEKEARELVENLIQRISKGVYILLFQSPS